MSGRASYRTSTRCPGDPEPQADSMGLWIVAKEQAGTGDLASSRRQSAKVGPVP